MCAIAVVVLLAPACGRSTDRAITPPIAVTIAAPSRAPVATGSSQQKDGATVKLSLASPAFPDGSPIPRRFTSDGEDTSPPLEIRGVPGGARSLALVVDDPDAPVGTWVHWVAWNLPPDTTIIEEGSLPPGAVEGRNSWGNTGYGGPSPPSGTHRYFFTLYALDTALRLPVDADRARLDRAMAGHVLAQARLVGRYARNRG